MTDIALQCHLGGVVVIMNPHPNDYHIGHSSGPAIVKVPTYSAARIVAEGLANATTYGEADSYAPGLLSQGMTDLERFMADPDNQPSPGGRAALRRLFL